MNKIINLDCVRGLKQLEDNSVDLCVTSPPYNVGIQYDDWDDTLPIEKYYKFTNLGGKENDK